MTRAFLRAFFPLAIAAVVAGPRAARAGTECDGAVSSGEAAAISAIIADLLANEPGLPLPVRQRAKALNAYYQDHAGRLLWIGTGRMVEFVARAAAADEDGLDPASYPSGQLGRLSKVATDTDARSRAIIELYFSAALLEYASDIRVGRLLPRKVDPGFFLQDKSIDQVAALNTLGTTPTLDAFLARWQPQTADYVGLKRALAQYRLLASRGGWPTVPIGETLKPGLRDPRVPALRARLAVSEGVPPAQTGAEDLYDPLLVVAVKAFQARHGIDAAGAVGKGTVAALNVSVEDRMEEIAVAMERWRWMPDDLGFDYLIVNIAGFELKRVTAGKVGERMNVVVGKAGTRTPVFSDRVRYLEFNPYWNVPPDIAVNEELPVLRRGTAGRMADGFEAVRGDQVIPLNQIDWNSVSPGNFPYQLRQRPGLKNALGRVKFMFPNQFNVYLHDTPSRSLFVRSERAFSHGCIRLARPLDLAVDVLRGTPGWDRKRIDEVVADGDRLTVNLAQPLPIHITYLTAWVENGQVNFRNDIYKQDEKLMNALAGRSMAW
ncbi:L,D-transpeptidase family protein [soil metagenome]